MLLNSINLANGLLGFLGVREGNVGLVKEALDNKDSSYSLGVVDPGEDLYRGYILKARESILDSIIFRVPISKGINSKFLGKETPELRI